MKRRAVLAVLGASVASLSGCTSTGGRQTTREKTTAGTDSDGSPLTDWEATTDCEGEPNDMHDSVVKVAAVETSIDDGHAPIHFSDLTTGERAIARSVTETGGYGTCEVSDAFSRLVDRVSERTADQSTGMTVYLERDGVYYALYVEVQDEVYAY